MPPVQHTAKEENDFMKNLLAGIDAATWDDVALSPEKPHSPLKSSTAQLSSPLKKPSSLAKPIFRTPCKNEKRKSHGSPTKKSLAGVDITMTDEALDDFLDFTLSPEKPKTPVKLQLVKPQNSSDLPFLKQPCTRCVVVSVNPQNNKENGQSELSVVVQVIGGTERRLVLLQDDWAAMDIKAGHIVNVIGEFTPLRESSSSLTSSIAINLKRNLLILHPDILITATALSNALECLRKPLLSSIVRASGDISPALVWGNMLHTVMQSCLSTGHWDEQTINANIDNVIQNGLSDLFQLNMTVSDAQRELKARTNGMHTFAERYISQIPKPTAMLSNTRVGREQVDSLLAINGLLDVEEDIWSPKYGMKGKLDATVSTIVDNPNPIFPTAPKRQSGPKPLEIKTGRAFTGMEHRAQTMLYNVLASERYEQEVASGLLYYTQSEGVIQVPTGWNEIRALFMMRNRMAVYMLNRQKGEADVFLPPTLDDERTCKRCFTVDTCMLYRRAVDKVVDGYSPIADLYDLKTSHLTDSQADFFKSWDRLLALEEQDLNRFRKELWTMDAKEREGRGRCFSSMALDKSFSAPRVAPSRDTKIHQFTCRFVRRGASSSLLNGFMSPGDPVIVSVEPDLLGLARGFILELTPTFVVLGLDHDLSVDRFPLRNKTEVLYRIDKDELSSGMSRIRNNLAQLFYVDGDLRRRRLVVDLETPKFAEDLPYISPAAARHFDHLNANQKQALHKVLKAQDYALVLGMPGTGKTTVIAAMIKTLVNMGKTILLTSYTHSAVDNILMKLKDGCDFGILRMGNADKVHPAVKQFTLADRRKPTTVEQLEYQLMTPPVVATTSLSIDHALFSRRKFDYCIIDEASQITLPTCLGPLRFADRFVLVGDHFQLPPLVRNPAARQGGLDVSLFRRLSDAHPHAVVDLAFQYRMNDDIMLLSNKLIYGDRLRCGSQMVANQTLKLPDAGFFNGLGEGWLRYLLDERCKAVFVDTDNVPARDSRVGDLVQNEMEAALIYQLTEALLKSGVAPENIGILSLYRQQIKVLNSLLYEKKGLEILTADRSQGRDKDCIVISMVRSNEEGSVGDLVKDWRRMNVSFTRARSKLIIFGSRKTLVSAPLLKEFFGLMAGNGWIYALPKDAHRLYATVLESKKRLGDDKENSEEVRPAKKAKVKGGTRAAVVKGRPLLKDLINEVH